MTGKLPRLSLEEYEQGVRARDRTVLARAITLVESLDPRDAEVAQELLRRLLPLAGGSRRVGVTGVPGVGKSTFLDALGMYLLGRNESLAVLAIDPTSSLSGGSILGDKTRMGRLALEAGAFIRPTPSGMSHGGIARRTRETMLLCEAAGYGVVFVETVGVGQGEIAVSEMVDFLLVLALPGAGDELQGIKKGVLELADAIAVNKCDGEGAARARGALGDLRAALRYVPRKRPSWEVRALAVSGLTGEGIEAVWDIVEEHRSLLEASGELLALRAEQQRAWMWALVRERLERSLRTHPAVVALLDGIERDVVEGRRTAPQAAETLLECFESARRGSGG